MFIEKKRKSVSPRLFTANGNGNGLVTVADASDFFVKQKVQIKSNTQPVKEFEIKRFVSNNSFKVGPVGASISTYSDLSQYLVADSATISAPEQDRPGIKPDEIRRATYAEEPIVAKRVIMVDEFGNYYNSNNPLPINAQFSGSLSVNLDGFDNTNPDSVLGVGSEDGTQTGIKHAMRVDSALDLRVGISDGANKAGVNVSGELSVIDSAARASLASILTALTTGTVPVSDSNTHTLLTTIIAGLVSIDNGIPAALGPTTMANSMPVTIATNQTPIPVSGPLTDAELRASPLEVTGDIVAVLGDEPIKISGTENGQPNGPEFPFVNNRLQQILKAKDRTGTITYADFGNKNQRITQITYTAPSIGTGPGFTAVKTFTYTLIGNRYRRDTPGDWALV
jgi:hypothetical protein